MRSHRPLLCALLCAAAAVGGVEGQCHAVIIAAGAPRTGSTQQLKLVKIALDNMGLTDNVVDAGYWRYQRHVRGNESTLAEEERETAKLQAGWTEHTIVLYKSHEFDAELLSLCSQALVVLTHSSFLESTARSAVLANFIPLDQDALHGHVDIVYPKTVSELFAYASLAVPVRPDPGYTRASVRAFCVVFWVRERVARAWSDRRARCRRVHPLTSGSGPPRAR